MSAFFIEQRAVKRGIVGILFADAADGGVRVFVQTSRQKVRDIVPPHHALLFQRQHIVGDELQNGLDAVFGVFQKAQQEFHGAVARAAPHAVDGRVQKARAPTRRLDGVAERQLLSMFALTGWKTVEINGIEFELNSILVEKWNVSVTLNKISFLSCFLNIC